MCGCVGCVDVCGGMYLGMRGGKDDIKVTHRSHTY